MYKVQRSAQAYLRLRVEAFFEGCRTEGLQALVLGSMVSATLNPKP